MDAGRIPAAEQRSHHRRTSGTSYGVPPGLSEALAAGYIHPDLPPPLVARSCRRGVLRRGNAPARRVARPRRRHKSCFKKQNKIIYLQKESIAGARGIAPGCQNIVLPQLLLAGISVTARTCEIRRRICQTPKAVEVEMCRTGCQHSSLCHPSRRVGRGAVDLPIRKRTLFAARRFGVRSL